MKTCVALVLLGLLVSCSDQPPGADASSSDEQKSVSLTQREAVDIAAEASHEAMSIPEGVKPVVEETETTFVVTYPMKLPPGVLGGDYYTKVTVDKNTGKIAQLLVSP